MKTTRILSLLLALAMVLGMLPVFQLTAKAAETFNPTPTLPADSAEPIILYEEDFNSTVGTINLNLGNNYVGDAAGWIYHKKNTSNGSAYIQDGRLYFSGSRYDMIYRDGGQSWGNYILEADFCYTDDCQSSAWGGMMYNFHSTTKWQKVGISLAGSASANGYDGNWTNNSSSLNKLDMKKAGLTIPGLGDPYRMKVVVHNKTADFYYAMLNEDGSMKTDYILLKSISNIPADAQTGTIGFMTSSDGKHASYWVDNIKCYSYNDISYTEDFESYGDVTLTADADNTDIGVYYDKNHTSSTASIQDGRLYLNGGGTGFDAIFLNMGKNWTNYTLEADVTFTEDYTGWSGLLYRSTDVDNFQKAMLGTNGRVNMNGQLSGSWYKNKEGITLGYADVNATVGIPTRLRIVVEEGTAEMYVAFYDTTTGVLGDFTEEPIWKITDNFDDIHMTGTAGVMVGGGSNSKTCSVWVDNIWVSRGSDRMTPMPEVANAADIYEPNSGIVNPPVVVQQLADALPAVGGERAAVVMMEVDGDMNVLAADGTAITTVSDFIDTYRYVLIPAFIVDSEIEASSLAALLHEKKLIDCYVMAEAENASLVRSVRMANTTTAAITGALIFDDLSTKTARQSARALVADNMSYVAISRTPLTQEAAHYFNVRQIAAWSWVENQADVFTAIVNGNHGIISTDTAMVYDVYEGITETTVSGKPVIIAHRGANNQQGVGYPENTLIGYEAAQEVFGADAIEIDVRITADGYSYLMHDGTVDRTTNGTGNGADYTLGELKNLVVDEVAGMETQVPTLEELLQKYQGTDTVVYCHINIKTDANVAAFSHLIEKYGFQDNILFFISYANRTEYNSNTNRTASSSAYGFTNQQVVTDGIVFTSGDADILSGLSTDVEGIVAMRNGLTAYNYQPLFYKYSNYGDLWGTESFYYQMSARGFVNSHSITNGQAVMDDLALTGGGVTGYLTDSLDKCDDYHYCVEASDEILLIGQGLDLTKQVQMIVGSTEASCGVTQLGGPSLVETENGYTLAEAGEVTLVYYATRTADGGSTYRVYSQPVTVTFSDTVPGPDVAVVNDTYYKTVQEAVDAANGGVVKLLADSEEEITATGDLYLDLNGYSLSKVTVSGTLYGMDSATNEYTASGAKILAVEGTYAAHYRNDDAKRYLAIAEGKGVSFHRFYMGITNVSLAPAVTGFGYKAEFYGDEAVQAQIESIGYNLWLTEDRVVTRTADFKNLLTLRLKNFDVANYGEASVNASVMITLHDGTVIESGVTSYSMRQMLEMIAESFNTFNSAQKKAVQTMCLAQEATHCWNIAPILNWAETVSLTTNYFTETSGGVYTLTTDSDALHMVDDVKLDGVVAQYANYRLKGTISLTNAGDWGQARILVSADAQNEYFIALEKTDAGNYQIFTMSKVNEEAWNNWQLIDDVEQNGSRNSIDFEVIAIGDALYFLIDDEVYYTSNSVSMTQSTVKFTGYNVGTTTVENLVLEVFENEAAAQTYADSKPSRFGETFGVSQSTYWTTNGVDLTNDQGEMPAVSILGGAPQYTYLNDVFTDKFSFETEINVSDVLNNDGYPKFGLLVNGASEMVKFFVDMTPAMTATHVGVVYQPTGGGDDWAGSKSVEVPGMSFTGSDNIKLKLIRDGQAYQFYVNDVLVLSDEAGFKAENGAVGIFSFNTELTASNYTVLVGDKIN